ncbi:hypothetical protein IP69_09080 [Bosea sp. AAP35]|uniref:hypothetical protein n=1 Tax=Bosea sp. AAP35 TaxID=1523417 RepID=UPI0006B9ABFD|nr:hypothetical protein [Bosea sp. AAP35]KPF70674.1 hypothetical protein IP69_09080 [Bosea sp. AAP35]
MNILSSGAGRPDQGLPLRSDQAYVIEIGETQAGLVSRRGGERVFTFISAASAFDALEGHRFATPGAAERAARQLASHRRSRAPISS